ncbi:MAG: hypothetical protein FWF41_04750 [Betaproteobacteria bacterium]|nr:hypothetical protein [Betaproteobacteria bacterium]
MNTFKKKALFAALTGLGVMGMVGSAQAVSLNPDGLGQVLIYPYYTVRDGGDGNAFNSLMSVVNSSSVGKAVKVRFLEGMASQEVLDFNLYLSKYDVWTGMILPKGEGAALYTKDTSCTWPAIPADGADFVNYAYAGDAADQTLNRTKEGYAEVIEMADILPSNLANGGINTAITHVNGVPPNCGAIADGGNGANPPGWVATDMTTGTGGLFGGMTLINPTEAQGVAFEAVALDGFYVDLLNAGDNLWAVSGSIQPTLAAAEPQTSVVVDKTNVWITDWTNAVNLSNADAVSAVLMNAKLYNEYVLDAGTASKTDWVVTMPTKREYYNAPTAAGIRPLKQGYTLFQNDFGAKGACDEVGVTTYNREEQTTSRPGTFSPPPPTAAPAALCWEANVVTFGKGSSTTPSLFHASNRVNLSVDFENGWTLFDFTPTATIATGKHTLVGGATTQVDLEASNIIPQASATYTGLPMVGFAVQQFNNGTLTNGGLNVWATYDGRIAHRFSKDIAP